jgi:ZIP family zinc transporter
VGVGFALGALAFYFLDGIVSEGGRSAAGTSLALGAFLDGIPEQMVLGLALAGGEAVSVALLAAIFVSNLPEALGSASQMRGAGRSGRQVLRLWTAVAAVCALASLVASGSVTALAASSRAAWTDSPPARYS